MSETARAEVFDIGGVLALNPADVRALMRDLWTEYLGTLNRELADYIAALRPRYRTGCFPTASSARAGRLRLRGGLRRRRLLTRGGVCEPDLHFPALERVLGTGR